MMEDEEDTGSEVSTSSTDQQPVVAAPVPGAPLNPSFTRPGFTPNPKSSFPKVDDDNEFKDQFNQLGGLFSRIDGTVDFNMPERAARAGVQPATGTITPAPATAPEPVPSTAQPTNMSPEVAKLFDWDNAKPIDATGAPDNSFMGKVFDWANAIPVEAPAPQQAQQAQQASLYAQMDAQTGRVGPGAPSTQPGQVNAGVVAAAQNPDLMTRVQSAWERYKAGVNDGMDMSRPLGFSQEDIAKYPFLGTAQWQSPASWIDLISRLPGGLIGGLAGAAGGAVTIAGGDNNASDKTQREIQQFAEFGLTPGHEGVRPIIGAADIEAARRAGRSSPQEISDFLRKAKGDNPAYGPEPSPRPEGGNGGGGAAAQIPETKTEADALIRKHSGFTQEDIEAMHPEVWQQEFAHAMSIEAANQSAKTEPTKAPTQPSTNQSAPEPSAKASNGSEPTPQPDDGKGGGGAAAPIPETKQEADALIRKHSGFTQEDVDAMPPEVWQQEFAHAMSIEAANQSAKTEPTKAPTQPSTNQSAPEPSAPAPAIEQKVAEREPEKQGSPAAPAPAPEPAPAEPAPAPEPAPAEPAPAPEPAPAEPAVARVSEKQSSPVQELQDRGQTTFAEPYHPALLKLAADENGSVDHLRQMIERGATDKQLFEEAQKAWGSGSLVSAEGYSAEGEGNRVRINKVGEKPTALTRNEVVRQLRAALVIPAQKNEDKPANQPEEPPAPSASADQHQSPSAPVVTERADDARGQPTKPPTRTREGAPMDLIRFHQTAGGIKDESGELRHLGLNRYPGLINNKSGISYDRAREAAAEAGYLGGHTEHAVGNTTVADWLDRMGSGQKHFSVHDQEEVDRRDMKRRQEEELHQAKQNADDVHQSLVDMGMHPDDIDQDILAHAGRLMLDRGLSPIEAWDRAAIQSSVHEPSSRETAKKPFPDIPWDDNLDQFPATGTAPFEETFSQVEPRTDRGADKSDATSDAGSDIAGDQGQSGQVREDAQTRAPGAAGRKEQNQAVTHETGADGKPQAVIPGAEKIGQGEQAQRLADKPLKGKLPQKDVGGLFGEDHKQTDLLDLPRQPQGESNGQSNTDAAAERTGQPDRAGRVGKAGEPQNLERVADGRTGGGKPDPALEAQPAKDVRAPEGGERTEAAGARVDSHEYGKLAGKPEIGDERSGREGASGSGLADEGAGERRPEPIRDNGPTDRRPVATRPNYVISDPESLIGGTPKVRFAKNRAAIETYNDLVAEGRDPTPEDLDKIAGYIGWGSFGQALFQGTYERPRPQDGWQNQSDWLREHLGKEAWESAQRSIINAHYTDPPTVKAMWDMAARMGFTGGRVLEPSMGIGNFFGLMPQDIAAKSNLTGIELDQTTGGMAKMLYPNANIQIKGYEESKTPDGFYDLAIGNWPFAAQSPPDRRYARLNPTLHDYFFVKALDQVRPGGIVMGITSAGTMDKLGKSVRYELSRNADLVAAFRLPSGAFEKYAGTSVVTDLIILQKRAEPKPDAKSDWLDTVEVETPGGKVRINEYYANKPENILGTLNFGTGSTYGRPSMIVDRPDDLMGRLEALPLRVPKGIYEQNRNKAEPRFVTNNSGDRDRSVVKKDGQLFQVQGDHMAPLEDLVRYKVKDTKQNARVEAEIASLIDLRKAYGKLIDADREGAGTADALRKALKKLYDAHREEYGPLVESKALRLINKAGDPAASMLAALERPDGTPTSVFTQPTVRSVRKLDNPSIKDAFVLARNESINFDPAQVAKIAKKPEAQVVKELLASKAIYRTPGGGYEVSDVYLSGNVRRKLREAADAMERGEDMQASIDALKSVLPKDIPYFNIEAKLGAGWVGDEIYKDFISHLLGINAGKDLDLRFGTGSWKLRFTNKHLNYRPEATTQWGHPEVNFSKLLQSAFNNQTIKIYGKDSDGNKALDEQASREATEKAARVREEFGQWLWKDAERKIAMEKSYNETMNAIATPKYDGSFLEFPGMALRRGDDAFSLREHQVNAIWRGISNNRGLYAHEVGTGKTYTMGGIAVESRRYGKARKPMILAHNANSASVAAEIQEMYPGAQILYVDNLSSDTIDTTLRRIANEDWDAVVLPHSLIDRMSLKEETLMDIAAEQIQALEDEALSAAEEDGIKLTPEMFDDESAMKKVRSVTAKQLVKQRNTVIAKIKKMAQRSSKENAVAFEDLGIDQIIVDEAHEFKKPTIATKMQMKGLNTSTSDRSIALQFLTGYVKKLNGGTGVHLFTGTPITNTLTEIFNMQRFVMDDQMRKDAVADWDTWFNTFADSDTDVELTPTGEYEPVTRLSAFVNTAELRRMIGQYMDTVFADDMPEFKPRSTKSGKTMADKLSKSEREELMDGRTENPMGRPYKKTIVDVGPMGPAQQRAMQELVGRSRVFKEASKKERREMMSSGSPNIPIRVETDASNAGLDPRLFDMQSADEPESKINRSVKNMIDIYKSHPQATQAVFMERGFSDWANVSTGIRDASGKMLKQRVPRYNLVKDMVRKLVAAGIPRDEIAVVDGSVKPEKRKEIARKMNTTEIRVVIGSTKTLGVGVNMQRNLRAMHHMDAPWMPGDLTQRNGRGERQGNQWNTVLEYRYLTEKLDGRRWQVLTVKDRFIKAFLKSDANTRIIDGDAVDMDDGESGADLAETLAQAAGDPRLLMVNKLKADVKKLEGRERLHTYGVADAKDKARQLVQVNKRAEKTLADQQADTATVEAKKGQFEAKIGGKTFADRKDAAAALEKLIANASLTDRDEPLGALVNGFNVYARKQQWKSAPDLTVYGKGDTSYEVGTPSLAGVEAIIRNIPKYAEATRNGIQDRTQSIERLDESAKQPFQQEKQLEAKKKLLADTEADLKANPVPAPTWLRFGAPMGSLGYVNGEKRVVEGHKWTDTGYYVTTDKGDVPYIDVKAEDGTPLYEEHPFTKPVLEKGKSSEASQQDIDVSDAASAFDGAAFDDVGGQGIAGDVGSGSGPAFAIGSQPGKSEPYPGYGPNAMRLSYGVNFDVTMLREDALSSEQRAHIQSVVDQIFKETGNAEKLRVLFVDEMRVLHGTYAGDGIRPSLGVYHSPLELMAISMRRPDLAHEVAAHETAHALEGLYTENELALFRADRERLKEIAAKVRQTTVSNPVIQDLPDIELRAHAYQYFHRMVRAGLRPDGLSAAEVTVFRRAERKLVTFGQKLKNLFKTGVFGVSEDTFEKIMEGIVGQRTHGPGTPVQEYHQPSKWPDYAAKRYPEGYDPAIHRRWARANHNNIDPDWKESPVPLDGGYAETQTDGSDPYVYKDGPRSKKSAEIWEAFRERALDFNRPVERLTQELAGLKDGDLPDNQNAYLQKRLMPGRMGERARYLDANFIRPITEIAKAGRLTLADIDNRLLADHAPERNAAIEKIRPDVKTGSGISNDRARAILDKQAMEGKTAALDRIADLFKQMREYNLQQMTNGDLITPETADAWRRKYENYADLRGWEDETLAPDDQYFGAARKADVYGQESKQAFGRREGSIAQSPATNLIHQTLRAGERVEANKSAQALYRAMQSLRPEDVAHIGSLERGTPRWVVDEATGLAKQVTDRAFHGRSDTITAKFAGQERHIVFKSNRMADAARRLNAESLQGLVKYLGSAIDLAKNMWTHLDPTFVVRHFGARYPLESFGNALMDHGLGEAISTVKAYPYLGSIHRAVRAAVKMSDKQLKSIYDKVQAGGGSKREKVQAAFYELRREGGAMQQSFGDVDTLRTNITRDTARFDTNPVTALRSAIAGVRHAMDVGMNAMDSAQRVEAYMRAKKRGLSNQKAALEAREATIDFSLRGLWSNYFKIVRPFGNTATQTGARMIKGVAKAGYAGAVRGLGGFFGLGMTMTLMGYLMGGNDDDGVPLFEKIPSNLREMNIVVMLPFAKDENGRPSTFTFALPYNFAAPYNLGASAMSAALKGLGIAKEHTSHIMERAMGAVLEALSPIGSESGLAGKLMPEYALPFYHVGANKNFFGGPIHTERPREGLANAEQGFHSTPSYWKLLAQGVNTVTGGDRYHNGAVAPFPEDLRETMGYFTSGWERMLQQLTRSGLNAANGEIPPLGDMPMAKAFFGPPGAYDTWERGQYYDQRNQTNQGAAKVKQMRKEGKGDQVPEADLVNSQFQRMFEADAKQRKGDYASMDEIDSNPNLSTAEKFGMDKAIESDATNRMRKTNRFVRESKERQGIH